jgi:hypothetical protein
MTQLIALEIERIIVKDVEHGTAFPCAQRSRPPLPRRGPAGVGAGM